MSTDRAATRPYFVVYAVLLVCTYLTWQIAYFDLGRLNTVAALGIAGVKAVLVVWFFMHLRASSRLTWLTAGAGLMWLAIMMALTAGDYLTR
jgi:cytochrome c oxidase subunit 4